MVISILSFPREINYGAVLQCYALCKILQDMGHKINIIDLRLRRHPMQWYSILIRIPMFFFFYRFRRKHLNYFTRHFKSLNELRHYCPQSDLFIVGSDQVWNPEITKRSDPLYFFFSFLPRGVRRISYAASFGTDNWKYPEITDKVQLLLSKFDAVSVREETGVDICKNVFNIDANLVLDPTLLLSSYDDICGIYNPASVTNKLIYYKFVHNQTAQKIIVDFAKTHQLEAVAWGGSHVLPGLKRKFNFSVAEWLNSIRYSQIVVTDSFHCMVFCVIFHKRFVALPGKPGRTTRQKSMLNQLGLSNHFCENIDDFKLKLEYAFNTTIDYAAIDCRINILRDKSINFLRHYCQL